MALSTGMTLPQTTIGHALVSLIQTLAYKSGLALVYTFFFYSYAFKNLQLLTYNLKACLASSCQRPFCFCQTIRMPRLTALVLPLSRRVPVR
jgi:hypothetical protein